MNRPSHVIVAGIAAAAAIGVGVAGALGFGSGSDGGTQGPATIPQPPLGEQSKLPLAPESQ